MHFPPQGAAALYTWKFLVRRAELPRAHRMGQQEEGHQQEAAGESRRGLPLGTDNATLPDLKHGDVCEIVQEYIGVLRNPVVRAGV